VDRRRKLDNWTKFAKAFRLDAQKPLQRSGGAFDWTPLMWAVLSNNTRVVKYLLDHNADVAEIAIVRKGAFCFYQDLQPLHLNMMVGHDDDGKQIFDYLLAANSNPYKYAKRSKKLGIRYGDTIAAGLLTGNEEMILHCCSRLRPRFWQRNDPYFVRNDVAAAALGVYNVVCEYDRMGAKFNSTNIYGYGVLSSFIQAPSEYQRSTDIRSNFRQYQ